jgi:hypothetical protein
MKIALIIFLFMLFECASTTHTFICNGNLLPEEINTNCGKYNLSVVADCEYFPFFINISPDSAGILTTDSLSVINYNRNNKIEMKENRYVTDSTFNFVRTCCGGGRLEFNKTDSIIVSFRIINIKTNCSEKQSFVLIPIAAKDKDIEDKINKLRKNGS